MRAHRGKRKPSLACREKRSTGLSVCSARPALSAGAMTVANVTVCSYLETTPSDLRRQRSGRCRRLSSARSARTVGAVGPDIGRGVRRIDQPFGKRAPSWAASVTRDANGRPAVDDLNDKAPTTGIVPARKLSGRIAQKEGFSRPHGNQRVGVGRATSLRTKAAEPHPISISVSTGSTAIVTAAPRDARRRARALVRASVNHVRAKSAAIDDTPRPSSATIVVVGGRVRARTGDQRWTT